MPNYLAPLQNYLPQREVIDAHAIRLRAFSERVLDVLSPRAAATWAPVDGVTMNIRSVTTGGVVAPGGPLVDIVPSGEKMLVEARLTPTDIDVVRPDLDAVVRFVAYRQRTTPSVNGKVVRVSADAVNDERTGAAYYTATVEVSADELARAPHVKLYPGMPVEIAIRTGSRTLLAYLMQLDSMSRSFRED